VTATYVAMTVCGAIMVIIWVCIVRMFRWDADPDPEPET